MQTVYKGPVSHGPLAMKILNGWGIYIAQTQWDMRVKEKDDWQWT